jgi:hypothetical protein
MGDWNDLSPEEQQLWLWDRANGVSYKSGLNTFYDPKTELEVSQRNEKLLIKKNYSQASRIMELEQELRMVKKEATETVDNVLDFVERKRALTRTGGGVPTDGDWLTPMKIGTEFLVRPKVQKTWILAKFMQAGCKNGNVLVIPMKGEEVTAPEAEWVWVDPIEFCKFWEFKGLILEPIDD